MTRKEIENMWREDCQINPLDLTEESLKTPRLHSKYNEILNHERRVLIALNKEYSRLKLAFMIFFHNPTKENGYRFLETFPPNLKLPRNKVYMDEFRDGDITMTDMVAKMELQEAKVKFIENILWSIRDRKDIIRELMNIRKFEAGG